MLRDPIVTAQELSHLADWVVLDCRPDADAYRAGHLSGAFHAQLERDLSAPAPDPAQGGRHPLPDLALFATKLGQWGITPDSRVVAYDDQNGANAAARLWWLLKAVGHERVQVVDGGLAALIAAGFTLTAEVPPSESEAPYPIRKLVRPVADIDDVERARTRADQRVLDVRAAFRYRGDSEPIDPVAGHIPGAVNVPLTENLAPDGTFKTSAALRAQYERVLAGSTPACTIVHCGSGVTACHTLLALERAGLHGAKLYVGSWSEWCRRPERAREPAAT